MQNISINLKVINFWLTGLLKKKETSVTTVRKIYCLIPNISDLQQIISFLLSLPSHKKHHSGQKTRFNLESLFLKSFKYIIDQLKNIKNAKNC